MTNLIGKQAPLFKASAVENGKIVTEFSLEKFIGSYVVFFFYPLDFTFVCPTELHAFQKALGDFKERNAAIIGCSVDSAHSHLAWLNTPIEKGGIQGISYPLASDLKKNIARDFHVLKEDDGIAYRGLFILDREGIIRHQLINDLPLGRSVDEVLRTLDALIMHETHGEVCPANWKVGDKTLKATRQGVETYFTVNS
jgi:peroxiredoxin (alkyl hydroperoxide reductase subunit C)